MYGGGEVLAGNKLRLTNRRSAGQLYFPVRAVRATYWPVGWDNRRTEILQQVRNPVQGKRQGKGSK